MRMHIFHFRPFPQLPKHVLDPGHRKTVMGIIQCHKQRFFLQILYRLPIPAATGQISPQVEFCPVRQICPPFFTAFSIHYQLLFSHFDVIHVQRCQFGNSDTCGIQKLNHGPVPNVVTVYPQSFQFFCRKWFFNGFFHFQHPNFFTGLLCTNSSVIRKSQKLLR